MAFDAVMKFTQASKDGIQPKGESIILKDGITLGDQWSFSLENKLNIGPHTSGAGSGKAEFEAFTIKKQVDKASATLFVACGRGVHFNSVDLKLFKSTGAALATADSNLFLHWTFNMLAIEKLEWAHAEDSPEETVTFRFGACKIIYYMQDERGCLSKSGEGIWNQIANSSDFNKLVA
ncbi:type VI secretion system tube protein Hcp (plasmid) [Sinorhizobium medicae]|uniref:type VI secretion system tube protein Hcp n=1 Tax=Rhizobiaceae TaxID=82115 RepID=UPI001AAF3BD0|nr:MULTISPECIES: type VI secretion system tube protein Hcp [Rhizobiaceae]MCA0804314.1 type VI secretion system tube protein Hcp [Rhizobium sp. T1473]WQO48335.1 type VI secretion system tube protein Hcp [Sinorhizobium medicae]WQO68751.1 type VI secretion system tube protein Hcp [Sinorhizobium medicae]WQO75788.1 type VI secretion system tube protein Hcp [Sinorhizobium medicae]WQO94951.1 type VI secretion system tube protein Hcp [Sinorhizobium medicae]